MAKIDIKGLARELNISASTVSRALRDSHEISKATIDKVKALAEKLNYQPHPYAGSLRKNKTKTIGIVVPEVSNNFFAKVFSGIEVVAQENNYHALIYLTHDDYDKEKSILHHLQSGRVDGVIMSIASNTKDHSHIEELIQAGIQVIFFDRIGESFSTTKITTDDYNSAYKATVHLIEQGCKKPLHITRFLHQTNTKYRKKGFIQACKDYHLPIEDNWVIELNDDAVVEPTLTNILKNEYRPDGIFSSVETLSLYPYKVCKELGITMPDQLKFVSFSNMDAASFLVPALTTVTQPAFEIGKAAAMVLFQQLEKKKRGMQPLDNVFPSTLIVRESSIKNK
ncbi:LacI family DNA-binding transcriptional regulator [Parasediminibacterium paludis]|uniref:LacI family DNA-binding transcriptional regulator n=1 Tax=Parasediminibacterium paludis TaxID=908966 RepID=A0ABV8PTW6_9BACT